MAVPISSEPLNLFTFNAAKMRSAPHKEQQHTVIAARRASQQRRSAHICEMFQEEGLEILVRGCSATAASGPCGEGGTCRHEKEKVQEKHL